MRNKIFGKQLSRNKKSRIALFRSLTREVVLNGEITTTLAKAKAVQPDLEKLATLVKDGSIAAKRQAYAILGNSRSVNDALFANFSGVFDKRTSGFTRIIKVPNRRGDAAEMAKIGWVKAETEESLPATDSKEK